MNNRLNFGIVGAGRIAQAYAEAFEESCFAQVAAVSDVDIDKASALAERLQCPAYDSYAAMAEGVRLEAAIVCTPPVTHRDICIALLKRGVHVLCEKPLCLDSESARMMVEAARTRGVMLTMASKFRYVEDVIRARSIVRSGMIGEVVLIENAFTSRVDMRSRWNSDPQVSGGGVLIDNGTHSVDLIRYFLGPLAEVYVEESIRSQGLSVEETVRLCARNHDRVPASIDLSWSIDKELSSFLNVYGTQGTVSVGWKESKYRLASSRDWVVFGGGYDKVQAFRSQINSFAQAITCVKELIPTPEDALASVAVIEAAYSSLKQGRWVRVEPLRAVDVSREFHEATLTEAQTVA
ncbi:MAG: Gfo/Idh/MocA family oxidoreductase [Pyrinomonadaceae bacterium]|nr:Gfo/Idh/MocA family oxidoreductase [Pyrinomonadaceae bacterium]